MEPKGTNRRLRLRLKPAAESRIRAGHPWVFDESIREQNRAGEVGELAVIYDRQDRFLAVGLYDPESPIRVRILHQGKPVTLSPSWWEERLGEALRRGEGLFDEGTTGYRLINGENDGWPGLVLDRYSQTLVLKLYTAAWLPRLEDVLGLIQNQLTPGNVVLRLSRNIQEIARKSYDRKDGSVVQGDAIEAPVIFSENGARFEADVLKGQKTGFFLDQRENRRRVEDLAKGGRVLNAFSFSGGFSVFAARGGARAVTDLDISAHALESARRNLQLNQAVVKGCRYEQIQADAFEWLPATNPRAYDLIILDPPSLARREAERDGALQAYRKLCGQALRGLSRGGKLVACSCSAHVPAEAFFGTAREAARASRRNWREMETTGHAPDHMARFKEGEYLKAIYLQVLD
jgi:23S rRNA (cytosine1962-C5)-methyltransferase